jgi:hypothetical protein
MIDQPGNERKTLRVEVQRDKQNDRKDNDNGKKQGYAPLRASEGETSALLLVQRVPIAIAGSIRPVVPRHEKLLS